MNWNQDEKSKKNIKPILKWVGGKRKLYREINKLIPKEINVYFELFFGGGAIFFNLQPNKAVINDLNDELMNVYKVIKDNPKELIKELKNYKNEKEMFYAIRSLDRDKEKFGSLSEIQRASRLIYLNKTCYNGLYRVNMQGELNSPFGKYKNPLICDEELIYNLSVFFNENKISILSCDFYDLLPKIKKGDFVYLDPPYDPISDSSNFTGYTANGFNKKQQEKLKRFCDYLNKKGVKFLLSNSDTDFIKELYKDYNIKIIKADRNVSCKGNSRNKVNEVLIYNYVV